MYTEIVADYLYMCVIYTLTGIFHIKMKQ